MKSATCARKCGRAAIVLDGKQPFCGPCATDVRRQRKMLTASLHPRHNAMRPRAEPRP